MILLEEGTKEHGPWVRVEIQPGRWPFEYWFEVHFWDANNMHEGQIMPCWFIYHEKGGGGFGLWFVWQKAREVLSDVWFELYEKEKHDTGSST